MLALVMLLLSGAPKATCAQDCNTQMTQCTERCGSGAACMDRCERRLKPCTDKCSELDEKAQAGKGGKMPCGGSIEGRKVTFCTPEEERKNAREQSRAQAVQGQARSGDRLPEGRLGHQDSVTTTGS